MDEPSKARANKVVWTPTTNDIVLFRSPATRAPSKKILHWANFF